MIINDLKKTIRPWHKTCGSIKLWYSTIRLNSIIDCRLGIKNEENRSSYQTIQTR